MADLIGNAGSGQLLLLMAFPITGILIFASIIVLSFTKRTKKSKMKLGIQAPAASTPKPASPAGDDLNTSILSQPVASPPTSPAPSGPQPAPTTRPATAESPFARAMPNSLSHLEARAMTSPNQSNPKKMNPAQRLNNPSAAAARPAPEAVELLRLLRDPQSGQLVVEIAGQRYSKLADIVDKEIGQYVLKITAHLLAFTNGMIATDAGLKSTYNPKVGQTPEPLLPPTPIPQLPGPLAHEPSPSAEKPAPPEPIVPPPPPEAEAAFTAALRSRPRQIEEPPPARGLFGRPKPAGEPQLMPQLNLAEEINEIVQTRLMASPLAATTKIDISANPGGGIQINVNNKLYSSPDDIPHPDVKQLIKDSIKQWERS